MTELLYYADPMRREFSAAINAVSPEDATVVLDRTLFYPEGGGQPADRGTIDGIAVTDVQKNDDGTVVHTLERVDGLAPGREVTALVDWDYRFEYMQQHTGQHVLSAALLEVAGAGTVSVAQGSEVTSIEIDTESLTDAQIATVTARANEAIREDLPIEGFWIDDSELSEYRLRRPTARTGRIRLVRIGAGEKPYDLVACGGVHLPRTGLLNLVQTVAVERIRGHQRLHFKIGKRALIDYHEKHLAISAAAELFSAQTKQVPERIAQEQREAQELRRVRRLQSERIAALLLAQYTAIAPADSVRVISLEAEDGDVFKALAEAAGTAVASREIPSIVVTNRATDAIHWAIAVGGDAPFPADRLRSHVLVPLGAKGGGKPPLWRGVIPVTPDGDPEKIVSAFIQAFREVATG